MGIQFEDADFSLNLTARDFGRHMFISTLVYICWWTWNYVLSSSSKLILWRWPCLACDLKCCHENQVVVVLATRFPPTKLEIHMNTRICGCLWTYPTRWSFSGGQMEEQIACQWFSSKSSVLSIFVPARRTFKNGRLDPCLYPFVTGVARICFFQDVCLGHEQDQING